MTEINHVETTGAILTILLARKRPFVVVLRATVGPTEVASFMLSRYETRSNADAAMYEAFANVNDFIDNNNHGTFIGKLMKIVVDNYGDCAFAVRVVKLEGV